MKKVLPVVISLILFAFTGNAQPFTGCADGTENPPSSDQAFEADVFDLVNEVRMNVGKMPLVRVDSLDRAARYHATDMALDGYFSHRTYDSVFAADCPTSFAVGSFTSKCSRNVRVTTFYLGTGITEDETAWAGSGVYNSPDSVVNASGGFGWISSPSHSVIMKNGTYTEAGVGYYTDNASPCINYCVMVFGHRVESSSKRPYAYPDAASANDGQTILIDVQGNDKEPNGDALTTTAIITNPSNGSANIINGDSIEYTSTVGFTGPVTIDYEVCDGSSNCDTATVTVTVSMSGINELNTLVSEINIYPSPVNDELNISLKAEQSDDMQLEIVDITGKRIKLIANQQVAAGSSYNFSASTKDLNSGLYFCRISSDRSVVHQKFIVQR